MGTNTVICLIKHDSITLALIDPEDKQQDKVLKVSTTKFGEKLVIKNNIIYGPLTLSMLIKEFYSDYAELVYILDDNFFEQNIQNSSTQNLHENYKPEITKLKYLQNLDKNLTCYSSCCATLFIQLLAAAKLSNKHLRIFTSFFACLANYYKSKNNFEFKETDFNILYENLKNKLFSNYTESTSGKIEIFEIEKMLLMAGNYALKDG